MISSCLSDDIPPLNEHFKYNYPLIDSTGDFDTYCIYKQYIFFGMRERPSINSPLRQVALTSN